MKTYKQAILTAILLIAWLVSGCSQQKKTTILKTECGTKHLQLSFLENKNIGGRTVAVTLEMDGKKEIIFNRKNTLYFKGFPYHTDIIKSMPNYIVDTATYYFTLKKPNDATLGKIALFIDPKQYTLSEFETMAQCLIAHRTQIAEELTQDHLAANNQIAMVLYSDLATITQQFSKSKDDYITIYPNGVVYTAVAHVEYTFSNVVPQSNTIIFYRTSDSITFDPKAYINDQGKSLADYFRLEMVTTNDLYPNNADTTTPNEVTIHHNIVGSLTANSTIDVTVTIRNNTQHSFHFLSESCDGDRHLIAYNENELEPIPGILCIVIQPEIRTVEGNGKYEIKGKFQVKKNIDHTALGAHLIYVQSDYLKHRTDAERLHQLIQDGNNIIWSKP